MISGSTYISLENTAEEKRKSRNKKLKRILNDSENDLKNNLSKKWKPIIDNLNLSDDKKKWMNDYVNYHQLYEQTERYGDLGLSSKNNITSNDVSSNQDNSRYSGFTSLLPIAMKVAAHTIGNGGYYESEERIKKRERTEKLKRILGDDAFSDIVSKENYDEIMTVKKDKYYDGLIPVVPMNLPTGNLFYMDYVYDFETDQEKAERMRKERSEKLERILNGI